MYEKVTVTEDISVFSFWFTV